MGFYIVKLFKHSTKNKKTQITVKPITSSFRLETKSCPTSISSSVITPLPVL